MNLDYFLSLARELGYGDSAKEELWGDVAEGDRLKIFKLLLSLRWVRKICNFEDDFTCHPEDYPDEYRKLAGAWSRETSLDEVPITIVPFVFFSFNGETFSLEVLANEVDRFFYHPDGTVLE